MFVQVLCLAKAASLVRLGTIAIDGTKVQGNASRHKAMSYGYMTQEVARLRAEMDELLKQARDVDAEEDAVLGARRGDELPEELRRQQDRLATIEAAMKRLEAEARAAADADGSVARKPKPSGDAPGRSVVVGTGPIMDSPAEKAQTNFTEPDVDHEDRRQGFGLLWQRPASVDDGCQIILACDVTAECDDKQQAEPMAQATRGQLDQAGIAPGADEAGERPLIPAALDTGYFSGPAVEAWSVRVSIRTSRRSGNGTTVRPRPRRRSRLRRPRRPKRRCRRS